MSDEAEMNPAGGGEPPKKQATLSMNPLQRPPVAAGATAALKPGLKLPPKPVAGVSALRPGLKLPPKAGATVGMLRPGLKLPTKPAVAPLKPGLKLPTPTQTALKPGLKLPTQTQTALKPGLKLPTPTQSALKPGLKLPTKPVIRKPGETVVGAPLPKPVAVDVQGVGKLPTVTAETISRTESTVVVTPNPKPMEALKSATQKLKSITQEIPQQAILRKTGIISEGALNEAQKAAAKHKTARISLSDAMGVAPVKNEAAPMKTIRIKRPVDIANPTSSLTPQPPQPTKAASAGDGGVEAAKTIVISPTAPVPKAGSSDEKAASEAKTIVVDAAAVSDAVTAPTVAAPQGAAAAPAAPSATATQRKTLKISRPGTGGVRPTGKFALKRPSSVATKPAVKQATAVAKPETPADAEIADIPDLPASAPAAPVPHAAPPAADMPAWATTLSVIVQLAACGVIGALAWYLYENVQLPTFCGGLGWGA